MILWKKETNLSITPRNLKSGGLHFSKDFYLLKVLEWTSGFRTVDDLPSAHLDETEFNVFHSIKV